MDNRSAIFLNIGGCLLSEEANVSSKYYQSLAWISSYIKNANMGMETCPNIRFCSGRNIPFIEAISLVLGRPDASWVIIENGAGLYNLRTKEFSYFPGITAETKKTFDWLRQKAVPQILEDFPFLTLWPGDIFSITFNRKTDSKIYTEDIRRNLAKSKLLKKLIAKKLIRIICFRNSISIVPPRINKGTAIDFLAEKEEIDLRQSLAIGDSKRDILFLNKVKFVGCPSNASDSCHKFVKEKKGSGRISRFPHAMGVVDIICYFTGIEPPDFLKN